MQRRLAGVWQLAHGPPQITNLAALALRSLSTLVPGAEFTVQRRFSADDVSAFVSLTGDANAIHTDAGAAAAAGLDAPILPGIMMASLFPAIIGSNFPGAVYASQTLKFRQPAEVGSLIQATVRLEKLSGSRASFATECRILAANGDSSSETNAETSTLGEVLVEGQALAIIKSSSGGGSGG